MPDQQPLGPLLVDVEGVALNDEDRRLLGDPAIGGVILFTRNYDEPNQLAALTGAIRALRPNLLIVADYEGGRVQRFRQGFTTIPPMRVLGGLYRSDPVAARESAAELAWLIAAELADVGVDMPLAPVVDLDHGVSQVIGDRAFAGHPTIVADLAGAFAGALASAGSAATIKHFPGHGFVTADSHAELPVDERPMSDIAKDWAPFHTLIQQGAASVMMGHIRYPAVDELPSSLSPYWIETLLRGRLGFEGCVFCDDLSMSGAAILGDYAKRTHAALVAGCDYLPVCNDRESAWLACETIAAHPGADGGAERRLALRARLKPVAERAAGISDPARLRAARATAARLQMQG